MNTHSNEQSSEPASDFDAVCRLVETGKRKFVVLDDDPTGTQTVHGIDVLTEWSVPSLTTALSDKRPGFFILTNSRAFVEEEAIALTAEIARNLRTASEACGQEFSIISRSDSTMRGHFRAELQTLVESLDRRTDGVIVTPAFFEGGRVTIDNVHYVAQGEEMIPVGETEFARDATFGFRNSDLTKWIEEKMLGKVLATEVVVVSIDDIRNGGADTVRTLLSQISGCRMVVLNVETYHDMEVFMHGLLLAERDGKRFLYRTGASFVRIRAGLPAQPLMTADEIKGSEQGGGLIVVGSYVKKTTEQLEAAFSAPDVRAIEVKVDQLAEEDSRDSEIVRVSVATDEALRDGKHALVFTSRAEVSELGRAGELNVAQIVSGSLVKIVRSIRINPSFIIAKGGITSSDIAVKALGVRKALIVGQASPGIPVWKLGDECERPGLNYIVFPGNVGTADTLCDLISRLGSLEYEQ